MKRKYILLCGLFLIGAIVAGSICVVQWQNQKRAEEQLRELSEKVQVEEETVVESEPIEESTLPVEEPEQDFDAWLEEKGIPNPERQIDFADLQENTNQDIYAWIYIPDTVVDYPIVQHPTDNTFYLEHNMDGSMGRPGCIYTENYNTKDFTDPNTVIYGHNMRNGSMFADLHKFEDSEFFEEHPYFYIYTEDGLKVYEIFAAHEFSSSHLILNFNLENEVMFQSYLNGIMEQRNMTSNLRKDVELTAENRIVTLSTCVSGKANNRYLVQGVLLNED